MSSEQSSIVPRPSYASTPEQESASTRTPSVIHTFWYLGLLGLSLFAPSTGLIQRYLGLPGVLLYLLMASALLVVGHRYLFPRFLSAVSEQQLRWLVAGTFLLLLLAFLVIYPMANTTREREGSDGDEALNIATTELLHGRYPYYLKTYLGNPITPMPGALLLASPFVLLLGNGAYQNFFWLFLFFVALKQYTGDGRLALLFLWVIFALSPAVLHSLLVGSDYVSNTIYVLLSLSALVLAATSQKRLLFAALFGVALSSRANFLLLLPLVFSLLVQRQGWRWALLSLGLTLVTFTVLTLPFYLFDPAGFSPLHTSSKFGPFQIMIPLSGIVALLFSLPVFNHDFGSLLRNSALVQAFPSVSGVVLGSIVTGRIYLLFMRYGIFFLFFGALAAWLALYPPTQSRRQSA